MTYICIADRQDITYAGMLHVCSQFPDVECQRADDKAELLEQLKSHADAVVVLDFTLFDINDVEELLVLMQRFPMVRWILFSVDLSVELVRRLAIYNQFCVLLKESPMSEICECLHYAVEGRRYICQHITELLLAPAPTRLEDCRLTPTETEILKDIALGMTTREIAERRFSSFHTVNTHRKNIFRKLGVNTVHEATKYALRAGLVDSAEYYI